MLLHLLWDHWSVCETLQQKPPCLQNEKGLGLNKPRQRTQSIRAAPPRVCGQNGCHSGCPDCPQNTGSSSPSSCRAQLGPRHPRWFGVWLPHFKHSLNKRSCWFLLGLAESRHSINICWMSLIILMKRASFVLLGHWVYHLLNGLWLPGLTNL